LIARAKASQGHWRRRPSHRLHFAGESSHEGRSVV